MDTDATSRTLAHGVQRARHARGWTLDELAARSGVSRRLLVQVEQGQGNPTITTLLAISDALGIGLPRLLEVPERPRLTVRSRADAPVVWRGDDGGSAVLLAGTPPPDVVELWSWTLAPGEHYSSGAHTEGTREMLTVEQGSVQLRAGDTTVVLGPGDTASFSGEVAHAYGWADGDDGARFTLVTVQPRVGAVAPQRPSREDS